MTEPLASKKMTYCDIRNRHVGLLRQLLEHTAEDEEAALRWAINRLEGLPEHWVAESPSETAAPHPDTARLDWLQAWPDRFANIDRITSVRGLFNGFATLREAIDNEVDVRPAPNGEAPHIGDTK